MGAALTRRLVIPLPLESMSKLFFSVSISLDGYIAPEGMDLAHGDQPNHLQWMDRWMALQQWVFQQKFFRDNLKLGDGGDTGVDNALLEATYLRTGVSIMGKRMFEGGERYWPEEAPFHTPVFVLTHEARSPWVRPGGTTFYFVNDGIESALRQAREASGGRDIRIAGGAETIVQFLNAGLVDEFTLSVSPVVFGGGVRLFDEIQAASLALKPLEAIASTQVTHLRYEVVRPKGI